jgi:hypothetical protein
MLYQGDHFSLVYLQVMTDYLSRPPTEGRSRLGPVRDLGALTLCLTGRGTSLCVLKARAANPFFALATSIWMIAGRDDVAALLPFAPRIFKYSDDGFILSGAYGARLRRHHHVDQVSIAEEVLRRDPDTRRVVMDMWHPSDLGSASRDVPCNLCCLPRIVGGQLNFTVVSRSSDLYLGLPSDIFAFATLQRFLALRIGVPVGTLMYVANSAHVYSRDHAKVANVCRQNDCEKLARRLAHVRTLDCSRFLSLDVGEILSSPGRIVPAMDGACALWNSHVHALNGDMENALGVLCPDEGGHSAVEWYLARKRVDESHLPEWFRSEINFGDHTR